MEDLIFGKINTVSYSTGDVSIYGTIQLTKLIEWAAANKHLLFTDSKGNQHLRVVSKKLKTPFERHTHILATNLDFKHTPNSQPINNKPDEVDDIPF